MDDASKPSVTISEDGKELVYLAADGEVKWRWTAPTPAEWIRLKHPHTVPKGLANGQFRYPDVISDGRVTTWFQPERGLDFNLIYDADKGVLLSIADAR